MSKRKTENIDPIEVSICRAMITSVIPTAMMPFTEICWRMFSALESVRKAGDSTAITTVSSTNPVEFFFRREGKGS